MAILTMPTDRVLCVIVALASFSYPVSSQSSGSEKRHKKLWLAYCVAVRERKDPDRRKIASTIQNAWQRAQLAKRVFWHEFHFRQSQQELDLAILAFANGGHAAGGDAAATYWGVATALSRQLSIPTVQEIKRFCEASIPAVRVEIEPPELTVIVKFHKKLLEIQQGREVFAAEDAIRFVNRYRNDLARIQLAAIENDLLRARVDSLTRVFYWVSRLRRVANLDPPAYAKLKRLPISTPTLDETREIYALLANATKKVAAELDGTGAATDAKELHAKISAALRKCAR